MEEIKKFAELQYEVAIGNREEYAEFFHEQVGFEFNGTFIINPWLDTTGRFELNNDEAVAKYGRDNINRFVNDATAFIRKTKFNINNI